MIPPNEFNVLDGHNGFTAITLSPRYIKVDACGRPIAEDGVCANLDHWEKVMRESNTLWRPASKLGKHSPIGSLVEYDEKSFYQLNNDVTKAVYKVSGYRTARLSSPFVYGQ